MKIPIKLKSAELMSLVDMLEKTIQMEECTDRMEAIVVTLLVKFYLKLKQKSILLEKSSLTINVEPELAMAFVEFFNGYPLGSYDPHTGNTVNKLIANYDKQTASFFR